MKMALLIPLVLTVSSCATNNIPVITDAPRATIDPRVLERCLGPVKVPDRELTRSEIVTFYNTNYSRLVACKKKHTELVEQIELAEQQILKVLRVDRNVSR